VEPQSSLQSILRRRQIESSRLSRPKFTRKISKISQAQKQIGNLENGDLLFIPALWFHNMKAIDAGKINRKKLIFDREHVGEAVLGITLLLLFDFDNLDLSQIS